MPHTDKPSQDKSALPYAEDAFCSRIHNPNSDNQTTNGETNNE
jgi:cytochrome c1